MRAAGRLLPAVLDDGWFFDTELLILAQRAGLRIHEVPVDWVDDPDSRVDIVSTAVADLRGVARLLVQLPGTRFLTIGVASTLPTPCCTCCCGHRSAPLGRTRSRSH